MEEFRYVLPNDLVVSGQISCGSTTITVDCDLETPKEARNALVEHIRESLATKIRGIYCSVHGPFLSDIDLTGLSATRFELAVARKRCCVQSRGQLGNATMDVLREVASSSDPGI